MKFKINLYRLPIQIAILLIALFAFLLPFLSSTSNPDVEAFCPFGGLQATLGYLVSNSLACSMTTRQISLGGMLIIGLILAGKLFCSHICPIGTLSEWLGRLGKIKKTNWIPHYRLDKGLRIIKYVLLFATFYFTITSNELFCKKFDPYFAMMSSGSGDIFWIGASVSLLFVFILPFFITNFWCKYICPLGAISNIFKLFHIWFPAVLLIIGLHYLNILSISWIVALGVIFFSTCMVEILFTKTYTLTGLKVIRDGSTCTNCKKCDRNCPMNISVSTTNIVNHIDCHLCGECINHCPEKDTLSFNKKKIRWAPSLFVILLISSGLLIAAFTEIPTINKYWGKPEQMQHAESFMQENIYAIKCYGSATSFATQIKEIKGVIGVSCFAGKHSAQIYFDPKLTSSHLIKKEIFVPSNRIISFPNKRKQKVNIVKMGIDHFFDPGDADRLAERLTDRVGIYAFSTTFGEPVLVTIYYDQNIINNNELIALINQQHYRFRLATATPSQQTNFKTTTASTTEMTTPSQMIDLVYPSLDISLNEKDSYKKENIKTITLNFEQSLVKDKFNWIPHLMSHLSADKGVINFKATCTGGKPLLAIDYIDSKTNIGKIINRLNQPNLNVFMDDDQNISIKNPFFFKTETIF